MPKTVNVMGHQVPRGAVITFVVGAVGIGGYELYKHSVSKATAATNATPSGAYGYGTGSYGYGSYGYGQYGYGSYGYGQYQPYGSEYYGYGEYGYGYYGSGSGDYYGSGFGYSPTPTTPTPTSTNQQWAQAALQGLQAQGFNAKNVTTAIGLYLQGKALSPDQASIISSAIGLEGEPPQEGTNGYPPAVKTTSTHHNPKPTDITVPNVTGIDYENAAKILTEVGLKAKRSRPNVGIVASENPKAGTKVKKGATITLQGRPQGRKPR